MEPGLKHRLSSDGRAQKQKSPLTLEDQWACVGRGERIRTSGLYVPNVALYQAKLHPDAGCWPEERIEKTDPWCQQRKTAIVAKATGREQSVIAVYSEIR